MEPDATIEPTNPTINRAESTPGSDTTTSVQQTGESTIRPGNHVTEHDETSDSDDEILVDSPGEFDLNSNVMTSMPASSSSPLLAMLNSFLYRQHLNKINKYENQNLEIELFN